MPPGDSAIKDNGICSATADFAYGLRRSTGKRVKNLYV